MSSVVNIFWVLNEYPFYSLMQCQLGVFILKNRLLYYGSQKAKTEIPIGPKVQLARRTITQNIGCHSYPCSYISSYIICILSIHVEDGSR